MNTKLVLSLFMIVSLLSLSISCSRNEDSDRDPEVPQFIAKDSVIGNNFFQVEFSEDSRSMIWCEHTGSNEISKVYYTDVDLNSGLPNLSAKQFIDNIQSQGWPYWGKDNQGPFFALMNSNKEFKIIRRSDTNSLTTINLGTVNNDIKTLINASNDATKPYFWISYVVKTTIAGGKDKLYSFRSDNPSNRVFINEEFPNTAGSAYELTFPRWIKDSETLL